MATARDLSGGENNVICVIGDGAMSAGMAYEALNNAGAMHSRLIVILNDNNMSIAPPVGAMAAYLARLFSGRAYRSLREIGKQLASRLPKALEIGAVRAEEFARGMVTGGTLFEELGFYYVGPIDGHRIEHLLPVLTNVRDSQERPDHRPCAGRRRAKATARPRAPPTSITASSRSTSSPARRRSRRRTRPHYTKVFGESLIKEAREGRAHRRHHRRHAVRHRPRPLRQSSFPSAPSTSASPSSTRVTFAAGLATEGYKPFCAIYSTFLQRAYDQVVHDVAIQNLPVRFAMDRAGLVGADGPTHAGSFDVAYLGCLPNFVVMAAADEAELVHMVATAAAHDAAGRSRFRYPRGEGVGVDMPEVGVPLEIGRGRIMREGTRVALLSLGTRLAEALKAAEELDARGLSTTVADARFAKPLDEDLIMRLAGEHELLITIEEGTVGGFGSHVMQLLAERGALDRGLKVRSMVLPGRLHRPRQAGAHVRRRRASIRAAIIAKVFEVLQPGSGRLENAPRLNARHMTWLETLGGGAAAPLVALTKGDLQ